MAAPRPAWQFQWADDDAHRFVAYDARTNLALNSAFARGDAVVALGDMPYRVDLAAMTQTNTRTGYVRRVRTQPFPGPAAPVLVIDGDVDAGAAAPRAWAARLTALAADQDAAEDALLRALRGLIIVRNDGVWC